MTNEIKLVVDLTQFELKISALETMIKRSHEIWVSVDKIVPNLEENLERTVRQKINEIIHEHESRRKEIQRLQAKTRKLDKEFALKETQINILNAEIKVLQTQKKEAASKWPIASNVISQDVIILQ